ncbi:MULTISPECIES: site-specific integrase [unclassified Thioalkalivibrio]|uniref:site-specific integrase n=1 Tax=unclassified Thioalkalivibrio TaxID=2621013 RepID=UPI000476140F|nr:MULTISPECIES: site-specific integrase [unclassified Thioalkalivibrio]
MVNVRRRRETGKLVFDFRYRGQRCRETTKLDDTPANRRSMEKVAKKIEAEITLGTFEYSRYFPNSSRAVRFSAELEGAAPTEADDETASTPLFRDFAEQWLQENEVAWRFKTLETNRGSLRRHLLPYFGDQRVSDISKADILAFRSELAKVPGRKGNATLSPKTINHTLGVLSMILAEAADRFQFTFPMNNLKRLKQPRKEIMPFTWEETQQIINTVRADYRDYFIVRLFTGLRTGEVHGLKWKYVDFEKGQILIRETYNQGRTEYTKNDGSQREVAMSSVVAEALQRQFRATGKQEYVFVTKAGRPLDTKNVTQRVWYPLLRHLGLEPRQPYQCRHTAATLWLASGENPEWIARQLGHTTTEMLFRVYSRYVPNLTRQDGSAMDRLLRSLQGNAEEHTEVRNEG